MTKCKVLILALLVCTLLGVSALAVVIAMDGGHYDQEALATEYKYEITCPERHAPSFFANDYEITECGGVVLYDAYIFEWGWRHTDTYCYPSTVTVTIKELSDDKKD